MFGPQTSVPPTKAYHYQLSGPVGWCATSTTQTPITGPLPVYPSPQLPTIIPYPPSVGTVNINRPNYFSITAVDSNNKPANVKTTAHVTLISAGGSNVGQSYSLGNITFNNQSNVIASFTPTVSGVFYMQVTDANGNTSQNNPNFPIGQGYAYGGPGYSDQPIVLVNPSPVAGFDHFAIRTPPAVKSGVPANISITPVNVKGIPVSGYVTTVMIYDTIPTGVQSFSLPADTNPMDGNGPTNNATDEPTVPPTKHALNNATGKPDTLPNAFAYEFQYGICDFAIVQGANIGINDIPQPLGGTGNPNASYFGTFYPTTFNAGTYPCVFNGPGQHVVIVEDYLTGVMTTVVVNVIQ